MYTHTSMCNDDVLRQPGPHTRSYRTLRRDGERDGGAKKKTAKKKTARTGRCRARARGRGGRGRGGRRRATTCLFGSQARPRARAAPGSLLRNELQYPTKGYTPDLVRPVHATIFSLATILTIYCLSCPRFRSLRLRWRGAAAGGRLLRRCLPGLCCRAAASLTRLSTQRTKAGSSCVRAGSAIYADSTCFCLAWTRRANYCGSARDPPSVLCLTHRVIA